jgi:hypothetical protein
MRINFRKSGKFSGEVGQLLNAFLKPFCPQQAPRCNGMNATLTTFYLI